MMVDENKTLQGPRAWNSYKTHADDLPNASKRRRDFKNIIGAQIAKLDQQRSSGFLAKLQTDLDKIVKEVLLLEQDKSNFSVFCWIDLNDYQTIKKNALLHKAKTKSMKEKNAKDNAFKLKKMGKAHAKE